jgi:HAMP domain-containing protein
MSSPPGRADPQPAAGTSTVDAPAQKRADAHPWWRRPRRIRRQLATALVMTALLAVATFGGLNYFAARDLLVRGTEDQLEGVGGTRAATIEAGADRLIGEVSATSSSLAVAQALDDFALAFAELQDEELSPQQRADLELWYQQRVVDPLDEAGLGPFTVDDLIPTSPAGRWLQYHYTVRPPGEPPPDDAGDGTSYSALNARLAPGIRGISEARGGGDVLLIDDTGTIVYTLDKRNDVGTSLVTGPYSDSALAQVVTERIPRTRVGTTLLTDFAVSATGRPSLFAVSAVRSGQRVVGALAVEIPVATLNSITGDAGQFEAVDLDEGDSYIVASDLLLQSEPRAWIEDPGGYLDRLRSGDESDQAEAELIELFGSPVGIQVVDTAPVRAALDGQDFAGSAQGLLGQSTFSAAQSFSPGGQQWVVVTEVPRSTVRKPLQQYLLRILLVLAIILPIVAALGIWLSRLFTRPIRPTVEAAEAIVAGERDPDLDTSRRDEFGDLGRRLKAMADSLAAHEDQLAREYERTRQLLLAVLPPQLVDDDGRVVGTGETAELATVIAVTVRAGDEHGDPEHASSALEHAAALAEQVAGETGLERVRIAADRYLFLAGIGAEGAGADAAIEFADLFRRRLAAEEADVTLDLHVGLSSGWVATGVLDTGSLTFGAWGDPVRRALALAALSQVDVVLIDASTVEACTRGRWRMERAHDVVDLDDEPMDLYTLESTARP